MQRAVKFGLWALGLGLLVGLIGTGIAGPEGRLAVWLGVGVALVVQLVLFVALFVLAFAERPLVAHGLGILGRLLALVALALYWLPWTGIPAAPVLFSLVAVFFVTTLLEPLFLFRLTTGR